MSAPLSGLERLCTRGKHNVILLSYRDCLPHNTLARLVSLIIHFTLSTAAVLFALFSRQDYWLLLLHPNNSCNISEW